MIWGEKPLFSETRISTGTKHPCWSHRPMAFGRPLDRGSQAHRGHASDAHGAIGTTEPWVSQWGGGYDIPNARANIPIWIQMVVHYILSLGVWFQICFLVSALVGGKWSYLTKIKLKRVETTTWHGIDKRIPNCLHLQTKVVKEHYGWLNMNHS